MVTIRISGTVEYDCDGDEAINKALDEFAATLDNLEAEVEE